MIKVIYIFVTATIVVNPWANGTEHPRMTYLSTGPVPLFFRTKPTPEPTPEETDLTQISAGNSSTVLVIDESGQEAEASPQAGQPIPEQVAEAKDQDVSDPLNEAETGNIPPVEIVEDTSENPAKETIPDIGQMDNGRELATKGAPLNQLDQEQTIQDAGVSDAYLEKLRWNLEKYRSGNLSSLNDLPVLPAHLAIDSGSRSDHGLSISKRPDIDLLSNSYFGKTSPVNSPHPQWEVIGDAILQEINGLSSGTADGHHETGIRKPYPFGFRAPGPVWIPANSSATYSNGNE